MSRHRIHVDIDRAAKLYADGMTVAVMAQTMGLVAKTLSRAMSANRDRFPLRPSRFSPPELTEMRKAQVGPLLAKGLALDAVAREIGIHRSTLSLWMKAEPTRFERPAGARRELQSKAQKAAHAKGHRPTRRHRLLERVDPSELVGNADGSEIYASADPVDVPTVAPDVPAVSVDAAPEPVTADAEGEAPRAADRRPVGAAAFLPLPGTTPVHLCDAKGCHWPVHVDGSDPLRTTTTFVCDAPKVPDVLPYCATHRAMHGGRGATGERDAHRLTQKQRAA